MPKDNSDIVNFDGHRFSLKKVKQNCNLLWMASFAREGDKRAEELLHSVGFSVVDINGKSYWPRSPRT